MSWVKDLFDRVFSWMMLDDIDKPPRDRVKQVRRRR